MLRWTVNVRGKPKDVRHQAAVAVGNKLYSFGGHFSEPLKDHINVYIFNTVCLRWRTLPPVATRRGERPLEVPCKRRYHTAVLVEDTIYMWGGLANTGYCNVLYAFDVDTHRWFKPSVSGTVPEGREDHSACVLEKIMFIHGGWTKLAGRTNDIYKLDTTTMIWSLINTRGTTAPASSRHSATVIGTKMFVFGGEGNQYVYYNSIRVFDTETNCWLNTPSGKLLPEQRCGHSAFAYKGELYRFGGLNSNWKALKDLWKLSPETFSWKEVKPKREGPVMMIDGCCCMVGDRIFLFGQYSDGLFILDLSPSLKTLCKLAVIQYDLEKSEIPHDIRWELAAVTEFKD